MLKALDQFNSIISIKDAEPGKMYYCQICKQPVLQRRGEIRIHHFAHYSPHGSRANYLPCTDTWSYDMTEWHMNWQNKFGLANIEKVLTRGNDKHIADVLIGNIVVEFQHSPISIENFRERNNFYTSLGYKVIWVFDLTEEFENQRIRVDEESNNCYHWAYVKKLFHDINIKEEKATIYFQFFNDDSIALERVANSYNEFKIFYTDLNNAFTINEFVDLVNNNDTKLFHKPKPKEAPNKLESGQTIYELWKENYSGMVVKNLFNGNVMIINGSNGRMYRENKPYGKIIGKYAVKDSYSGYYKPKPYSDYYNVWDADKRIWILIQSFIDKKYESNKKAQEAERELMPSIPINIEGCSNINSLIKGNTQQNMIIKNEHTKEEFILQIVDQGVYFQPSFNAFKYDSSTGEIETTHSNDYINKLSEHKIWKKINF